MTSLIDLPQPGENDTITAVIEIPSGSRQKIEYDTENDCFRLDRMLNAPVPTNYGFVPRTLCADGDPIDILVLGDDVFATGTVLEVRLIGMLEMVDEDVHDPKLIGIPAYLGTSDIRFNVRDGRQTRNIYENIIGFYQQYKGGGRTVVSNVVLPVSYALDELDSALIAYFKGAGQ